MVRIVSPAFLTLALASALLPLVPRLKGQPVATLNTLHSFSALDGNGNNGDGANPIAGLILGPGGNYYGAASGGGTSGGGVAYQIAPAGTLSLLVNFTSSGTGGDVPYGAPIPGNDGNLYGTNDTGSSHSSGTVYRLTLSGELTSLITFGGGSGTGSLPKAGLVLGSDGNFYGTTYDGGIHGNGAVFQITPGGTETVIYSFDGSAGDGRNPHSSLLQATDGNFYGTTLLGGANGKGTVYRVTTSGVYTTLYSFGTSAGDGASPYAGLIQASDGNFYGTTHAGGADGEGTVFRVTPSGLLTTLYSFTGAGDGGNPFAAVLQGRDGNFYGSTESDGANGQGTLFQLTPGGTLTTVYSFDGSDGADPEGALVQDANGNFYGTTHGGGASGSGTVFELSVHPGFFGGESALGNGVYYLAFASGNYFGYYSFLTNADYVYHFDLGYEYVFDASDGKDGVYLYDFASNGFFYTSPGFPFPYLYDFSLQSVLYYYPDTSSPGHYTSNPRYFYDYATASIITK